MTLFEKRISPLSKGNHCWICYLLNLFILCIIHLEPPVFDCFVYIRQDATQSCLEVLFYSIGAFNELQECSLIHLMFYLSLMNSSDLFLCLYPFYPYLMHFSFKFIWCIFHVFYSSKMQYWNFVKTFVSVFVHFSILTLNPKHIIIGNKNDNY